MATTADSRSNNKSCDVLNDQDVLTIVERKLSSSSFRLLDWSLSPLEEKNGFLGQYFSLCVKVKHEDKTKTLRFFAKAPPPVDTAEFEFLNRFNTFNKEISAYQEIVTGGSSQKWCPEFYLGKSSVIMVLEDVKFEGYVTVDKYKPLSLEHCIELMKSLCLLHSRTLILDQKLKRKGETVVDVHGKCLGEALFARDDEMSEKALMASLFGAYALIDLTNNLSPAQKSLLKCRTKKWGMEMVRLLEPSTKFTNVGCHRDVWTNNLMFKHDNTGRPVSCCLVDLQFLTYCPPGYDIMFSLYLTTDRATRDKHMDSLLRIYYETMKNELCRAGFDITECLPWLDFLKSCELSRYVAMIYTMLNMQIHLLNKEVIDKYFNVGPEELKLVFYDEKRADLVIDACKVTPVYLTRHEEVIHEMLERLPDTIPEL